MKTYRFVINKYLWGVTVLFNCDCDDLDVVLDHLYSIECPNKLINEAKFNIVQCRYNTGMTYSNYNINRSIIVINKTINKQQLLNSIIHETCHLVFNILKCVKSINEEEFSSVVGDVSSMLIKQFNV